MKETHDHIPMAILGICCDHGIPWAHIILCLPIPFNKIPQGNFDNDHSSITCNNRSPWDNTTLFMIVTFDRGALWAPQDSHFLSP